jgi:PAS domain S-box-containing protein
MYSFDDQVDQGGNLLKEPYFFVPALLDAANIQCFIFSMSADGVIQYVSESVEKILGYSAQEMVGKEFSSFLTNNSRNDSVRSACWKTIPNEAVRCSCELQTSSHEPLPVKMMNSGVFEDNALVGLVGLVQPDRVNEGSSPSDSKAEERARVQALADQLSKTEREVVELVVGGHMNKSMAKMLGVAVRTIEARRARAMAKLQVRSLPDLVKAWLLVSDH